MGRPTPMTRASTTSSSLFRATLPLLALTLAACSFSFKAGSGSNAAGKPAKQTPGPEATKPTRKPIAGTETEPAADPAGTETEPAADPAKPLTPPPRVQQPPPVVEPKVTAVCRVTDDTLKNLCHRVFDPIAADDFGSWTAQLDDGVTLVRPSRQEGMQRLRGPDDIRTMAEDVGGLRSLLHMNATDRVVVTLHNDCRGCARSFVSYETNSRSGTIVVTVSMGRPPQVTLIEVGSAVGRRPLGVHRRPSKRPATLEAPKEEPAPEGKVEVRPKTELERKPSRKTERKIESKSR